MVNLSSITAQVFILCLCSIGVSSNTNIFFFQAEPPKAKVGTTNNILVNFTSSLSVCEAKFLSVAIGSKYIGSSSFGSLKFQSLAAALAPCDFRVGGTSADFIVFDPVGTKACQTDTKEQDSIWDKLDSGYLKPLEVLPTITVTGSQWTSFAKFTTVVGWDMLFDVNIFFWRSDGFWNSTNAEQFLNYSAVNGIRIPYFQMGNEPNAYYGNFQLTMPPSTLLTDYQILKNLTSKYPLYASSKFCGPDVANVGVGGSARSYLQAFIAAGAYDVVDEYSLHHYYLDGSTATSADFLSVATLDSIKVMFQQSLLLARASPRPLPIRLTETSSCYDGGAPGLSNTYIAGFLWLDKLGLSAQYGVTRVFRQSIIGASYALITNAFAPNPDYYLSVLFKRLIEGPVFNISTSPSNPNLRVYAHCASTVQGLYSPGALAIYYLNLDTSATVLSLTQFQNYDLDLYLLTPGDANGLQSSYVKLNGNTLLMSGNTLPPMPPMHYNGEVTVTAQSFGFIVVPNANVTLCVNYYAGADSKHNKKY